MHSDSLVWTKKICRKWNALARTWPAQTKSTKTVETPLNYKPKREEMHGSAEKRQFEKLNAYRININKMRVQNTIRNMMMKKVLRVMSVVCHGTSMMARLTLKKELK